MKFKLQTEPVMIIMMMVIILASLYRNFNFKTSKFEPFWQSMIYILALVIGVLLLLRKKS
ncbi:hypothetical protein EV195_107192 [Tenacibaculum skagerrakense]|uniref:Uncharacterized protein n=1 Tax=Tenacibaculum skagerrakense TaxID=186571 RepID=A0A4V2SLM8_9FLAO|nr:hypothetical protein [Tenacibaculum skagerrakense]TCP24026.1 hypothetical protein EV195_107192 [Tenacibaculum skagerrakense]